MSPGCDGPPCKQHCSEDSMLDITLDKQNRHLNTALRLLSGRTVDYETKLGLENLILAVTKFANEGNLL